MRLRFRDTVQVTLWPLVAAIAIGCSSDEPADAGSAAGGDPAAASSGSAGSGGNTSSTASSASAGGSGTGGQAGQGGATTGPGGAGGAGGNGGASTTNGTGTATGTSTGGAGGMGGAGGGAPGNGDWVFGGNGTQIVPEDIAVDGSGNVAVVGYFYTEADFGGGPLISAGDHDAFVVKFDAQGKHLWSKRFGDAMFQYGRCVAFDAQGNVVVAGRFWGTIHLGGSPLVTAGGSDVFIGKFDPQGQHLWSRRGGGPLIDEALAVTVAPNGNVILTGFIWQGVSDFGSGPLTTVGNAADAFVAVYANDGTPLYSDNYGDANDQRIYAVAAAPNGDIMVAANVWGYIDFGGGPVGTANKTVVARLTSTLGHVWTKLVGDGFGAPPVFTFLDLAFTPTGDIVLGGHFNGTLDFGGGQTFQSVHLNDGFLAKLTPAGGPIWSIRLGGIDDQIARSVAVAPSGAIVVAGHHEDIMSVGSLQLMSAGGHDIFVAKLDGSGIAQEAFSFGDANIEQYATATAAGPDGVYWTTGSFKGVADFGGGPIDVGSTAEAMFLVARGP